ncbi:hypothetical protein J3Q64DRAFT_1778559 [Phycomyces blakesleeanus]|uniref:Transmembrane protein n=1 Tax=Phycomyces blakesleeanus TaxID=4837 RepID=A0ABR3AIE8_PHYBL
MCRCSSTDPNHCRSLSFLSVCLSFFCLVRSSLVRSSLVWSGLVWFCLVLFGLALCPTFPFFLDHAKDQSIR